MKYKSTWIMLAVLAALAAYFYGVEEPRREAKRVADERSGLLYPDLETEQVTELSLEGVRGRARLTKAEDGQWLVADPWNDRADAGRVRTLLAALKDLKGEREVAAADADLAPFGLSEPEVAVRTTGAEAELAVGAANPSGDSRYVRAGEGPVYVTRSSGLSTFLGDPEELRSKDVLADFPWDDLASVEVRRPDREPLHLTRSGDSWALEAPLAAPADPEAAGRLTEKLRWARVGRFLDEEPAQAEEKISRGTTVTLRASGGQEATLRLALVDGSVWAVRPGREAVFTVADDVLDAVGAPADALRRRKPVLVRGWKVERLELDLAVAVGGGEPLAYEKDEGSWLRAGTRAAEDEAAALQDFLRVLETGAASEIVDELGPPSEYGLDEPVLSARLRDADGVEQGFDLGLRDDALFARSIEGGPVYRMPVEYLEKAQALFAAARPSEGVTAPGE